MTSIPDLPNTTPLTQDDLLIYRDTSTGVDRRGKVQEVSDLVSEFVTSEADRAETAAEVAAAAGRVFTTTADGIAATVDGDYFWVVSAESDETLELWLNDGGVASDTGKRTVSSVAVNNRVIRVGSVAELSALPGIDGYQVIVSEEMRGGKFTYDSSRSSDNDGITVFDGWVRNYDGPVRMEWAALEYGEITGQTTTNTPIIEYIFNNFENILAEDIDVPFNDITVTAPPKLIKVKNATLRLVDGLASFENINDKLTFDLSEGGVINGGLRKGFLAQDALVGDFTITLQPGHNMQVGDRITTGIDSDDSWPNANRGGAYDPNFVTAVSGNDVTVQNAVGDSLGEPLFENMVVSNALFQSGLAVSGAGKVDFIGGRIEEWGQGYYLDATGSIEVKYIYTNLEGQGNDAFRVAEDASVKFFEVDLRKSYSPAKQLIAHSSSGDIEFHGGYFNRGNYDVEIYQFSTAPASGYGKIRCYGTVFNGANTQPISPDQVSPTTGNPVSDTYNFFGDALSFQSAISSTDAVYKGVEGADCRFENYQRFVAGFSFAGPSSNTHVIEEVNLDNCYYDCAPYFLYDTNPNCSFTKLLFNDSRVKSKTFFPIGEAKAKAPARYTGYLRIDNNGRTDAHSFRAQSIENLIIEGGGTVRFGPDYIPIDSMVIDATGVDVDFNSYSINPPVVRLINGGTIAGRGNTEQLPRRTRLVSFPASSTGVWQKIADVSPAGGLAFGRIDFYPARTTSGTVSFGASACFAVNDDGTVAPINYTSSSYKLMAVNEAFYISPIVSVGGTFANGDVSLRITSGILEMNIDFGTDTAVKVEVTSL